MVANTSAKEPIDCVEHCIVTDEKDVIDYERAFFRAYSTRPTYAGAMDFMEVVDGDRLRPFRSYDDYRMVAMKVNGRIVAGIKLIADPEKYMLTDLGFSVDPTAEDSCEGVNFFALADGFDTLDFFARVESFMNECLNRIKKEGIRRIYGTCGAKMLNTYSWMGFKVLDSHDVYDHTFYLIEKELEG